VLSSLVVQKGIVSTPMLVLLVLVTRRTAVDDNFRGLGNGFKNDLIAFGTGTIVFRTIDIVIVIAVAVVIVMVVTA